MPEPPPFVWHEIDFAGSDKRIRIDLYPPDEALNHGRAVDVSFRPGWPCEWADRRGCISAHHGGRVILATVHSGILGDGQELRHALEGTWLNAASVSLDEIERRMQSLRGAQARVEQEGGLASEGEVAAAVRVPADAVGRYFSLPVDEALELAAEYDPDFAQALQSGDRLFVIETCGWLHPQEPWADGVSGTSGSVYLVAIR